jgi:asparagine synthase (glutamine-hydrolysing)
MCGLTGYWSPSVQLEEMEEVIRSMAISLYHRGPNDGGIWLDQSAGLAFGHRRLAILDLSPEGHQPMLSPDSRYVLIFNGEIYNYIELRDQLLSLGHRFRGHSDTEVMLAAFCQWGIKPAVEKFVGMFAFALWDRQSHCLHLGRDRFGEKPLYYGWMGKTLLFGSELKALKAHPHWQGTIDRNALALFVRYGYVPSPHCIYQNIYKLPPATLLTLSQPVPRTLPEPQPYWSMSVALERGRDEPFRGDPVEAVTELERLLRYAISQQMVADVPLGAFLSGGIDSSTIVALMQSQSNVPVKTFTIGFNQSAYNEANHAKAVAYHLGTDHTELYLSPKEVQDVIPSLPNLYDEPFADPSQIPTFLVSQLARQQVIVSLSGDGGDELFGGYSRHLWANRIWQQIGWLPPAARNSLAKAMLKVSPSSWDKTFEQLSWLLPQSLHQRLPGNKIHKVARTLAFSDQANLYQKLCSRWLDEPPLVIDTLEQPDLATSRISLPSQLKYFEWMMAMDATGYLPDNILTKVDRASMGVSLESRVPFLNHQLVEFSATLNSELKIHQGQSKWILRKLLYKYVPQALVERPKMGFGLPLNDWLRSDLKDWAGELLCGERLSQEGWFHPESIRQKWNEHLSGYYNWENHLWPLLMFQMWKERN